MRSVIPPSPIISLSPLICSPLPQFNTSPRLRQVSPTDFSCDPLRQTSNIFPEPDYGASLPSFAVLGKSKELETTALPPRADAEATSLDAVPGSGGGIPHPHESGTPDRRRRQDDHDLHPSREPGRQGREQPGGQPLRKKAMPAKRQPHRTLAFGIGVPGASEIHEVLERCGSRVIWKRKPNAGRFRNHIDRT